MKKIRKKLKCFEKHTNYTKVTTLIRFTKWDENILKMKKPVFPKSLGSTGFACDLGRIQTFNLLSRNQVHYSVMLRGLIADANIELYYNVTKYILVFLFIFLDT